MVTSRFNDLRAALATLITTQLATDATTGVTVTAYPPLGDAFTREDRVWLEDIRFTQEPATQGASGKRKEDLEIDLVVYAPLHGGTADEQKESEERAELIFASVENAVRGDITISATVFNAEVASGTSQTGMMDDSGAVGRVEALITAEAFI